jgi:hypothetical protein
MTDSVPSSTSPWTRGLDTAPLTNPSAPPTPFAMPEYRVAEADRAADLDQQADASAAEARDANQRGDNYVLMTIMFALVIVLGGIGSKMDTFKARTLLLALAAVTLVTAAVVTFSFPIEI